MAFADGDGGQDIQKLVEDLRGGLRGTHGKAFAQAVSSGLGKHAAGSRFGYGAERADGERSAENPCVVIVDLVAKPGVAGLIESLELVKTLGIAVRHDQAVKDHDKSRGRKIFHFPGL